MRDWENSFSNDKDLEEELVLRAAIDRATGEFLMEEILKGLEEASETNEILTVDKLLGISTEDHKSAELQSISERADAPVDIPVGSLSPEPSPITARSFEEDFERELAAIRMRREQGCSLEQKESPCADMDSNLTNSEKANLFEFDIEISDTDDFVL